MNLYEYQRGHSLTLVQGHSDSTFSNFFFLETVWPIEAKLYVEPPVEWTTDSRSWDTHIYYTVYQMKDVSKSIHAPVTSKYLVQMYETCFFSPEAKAHWWAYWIGRPLSSVIVVCSRHSLNIFSSETAWPISQISYGVSMGWGNDRLFKWSRSHDHYARHAHIW